MINFIANILKTSSLCAIVKWSLVQSDSLFLASRDYMMGVFLSARLLSLFTKATTRFDMTFSFLCARNSFIDSTRIH